MSRDCYAMAVKEATGWSYVRSLRFVRDNVVLAKRRCALPGSLTATLVAMATGIETEDIEMG